MDYIRFAVSNVSLASKLKRFLRLQGFKDADFKIEQSHCKFQCFVPSNQTAIFNAYVKAFISGYELNVPTMEAPADPALSQPAA